MSVDGSAYDSFLLTAFYAVANALETRYGQNLHSDVATITARWGPDEIFFELPLLPVTSITSVTQYDSTDASGSLADGSEYKSYGLLDTRKGEYRLDIFRQYDEVECIYTSNSDPVPYEFRQATLAWLKVIFNDDRDFTGDIKDTKPPDKTFKLLSDYQKIHI